MRTVVVVRESRAPPRPGGADDPEGARSVWPQLHVRLVERIRGARSTMIFVDIRRLAERLATALNETDLQSREHVPHRAPPR